MVAVFRKRRVYWFADGRRITAAEAKRRLADNQPVQRRVATSRRWYVRVRLPTGTFKELRGYADKTATVALARRMECEAARGFEGISTAALCGSVADYLDQYRRDLADRGRTAVHVQRTCSRIAKLFAIGSIQRLADIQPQKVTAALAVLRDRGLATETRNHYLVAAKMFSRWLWRRGHLPTDPLAGLGRQNAEPDRRRIRAALTAAELARLVRTTECSARQFRMLSGRDRAALYLLAATSGLRVGELATLTASNLLLDAEPPRVVVQAAYSKHRRQDVVPLPPETAAYLRQWLADRPATAASELWPGTWRYRAAAMLAADLAAAGIPAELDGGRVIDFHSLRCSYATLLARQGVNLQTAQALLRHSDPKLTAKTYTRLGVTDLAAAVAGVSVLGQPAAKTAVSAVG